MDIKEKLQQFLDYKGIKTATFEKEVGLSNGYWRKTKSVSANAVADILRLYSEISAEWLFRGEGEMLRSVETTSSKLDAALLDNDLKRQILEGINIQELIKEEIKKQLLSGA